MENRRQSNHHLWPKTVTAIGVISGLIGILVFFTGKNFPDFLSSPTPSPIVESSNPSPSYFTSQPTVPLETPESMCTPPPVPTPPPAQINVTPSPTPESAIIPTPTSAPTPTSMPSPPTFSTAPSPTPELLTADELFDIALEYSNSGDHEAAIDTLQEAITICDSDWLLSMIYYSLGVQYADIGDDLSAVKYYKKCLEITPDDIGALWNITFSYDQLGLYDEAVYYYQLYIDYYPNDSAVQQAQDYIDSHQNGFE